MRTDPSDAAFEIEHLRFGNPKWTREIGGREPSLLAQMRQIDANNFVYRHRRYPSPKIVDIRQMVKIGKRPR